MTDRPTALRTTTLLLGGMRSVHCARAVYTALGGVAGVRTADVVVGRAVVEHEAGVSVAALGEAVALVGYEVIEASTETARRLPTL